MDSRLPLSLLFTHCYWGLCEMPGCRMTLYSGKSTLVLSVSPAFGLLYTPSQQSALSSLGTGHGSHVYTGGHLCITWECGQHMGIGRVRC